LNALASRPEGVAATSLREILREQGNVRTGPKFYQMMRRLEKAGLAESWFQQIDIDGSKASRTYYRPTLQGNVAWQMTLEFYAARIHLDELGGGSAERSFQCTES
jgi:hypothetical protein